MTNVLENFKDALDQLGIRHKHSGVSLAVEECPVCGDKRHIVLFRIDDINEDKPLMGRCQTGVCQQNYSSFSYLLKMGMDLYDVREVHGFDTELNVDKLIGTKYPEDLSDLTKTVKEKEVKRFVDNDISGFLQVDWDDECAIHLYAVRRGYVPEFKDKFRIDLSGRCLIFVCRRDDGSVIGYQRRYMNVLPGDQKSQSSVGFATSKHIMTFPREGADILVCEGPFTALAAWHYGYYGVCTFGSSVGIQQLGLIAEIAKKECVSVAVATEKDQAGKKFFQAISNYFHWLDHKVYVVSPDVENPKQGYDLNDAWQDGHEVKEDRDIVINPAIPDLGLEGLI